MLHAGQTAVIVPVPAAEPMVSRWRARLDSSGAPGMPAHITALYPFVPEKRLNGDVLEDLRRLCGERSALNVAFDRTAHFPEVLYLDPEPADELRRLTLDIAQAWPDNPPYGGAFDGVVPHLTVAHGADDEVLARVEADVRRELPIKTTLFEAQLCAYDGRRWQVNARLPFGS